MGSTVARVGTPIRSDRIARYAALIEREAQTLEELAQRVAEGEALTDICAAWDVPYGRVRTWLSADARRLELYYAAQEFYADAMAAETVVIADGGGGDTAHAALRIRARQWVAARWARERYGDAVQVQHTGDVVVRLTFGEAAALVGASSVVPADGGFGDGEGEI